MLSTSRFITKALIQLNQFTYYIHLKDHNKKINPSKNKLSLSFMNPKTINENVPKQAGHVFNLKRKTQKELERKMFEEYKQKVLKGQIDEEQQIQIDPLWGEEEKPQHYFQNISKRELMNVSHSQNGQFVQKLDSLYQSYFSSTLAQVPSVQQLGSFKPSQLVDAALFSYSNSVEGLDFWYHLQKSFGNRFYELSKDELIKLNFALRGSQKRGSPRMHNILKDLIEEDLTQFNAQQLVCLFYSFRHSKIQGVVLQDKILQQLERFYSEIRFEQKVNWLFTYTISRKPLSYKKAQQKIMNERVMRAHQLIFSLNFNEDISKQLKSVQQCAELVYSLAKLRVKNTQFLTTDIITYLKQNSEALNNDVISSYKLLYYLQQVEGGQGIHDQELYGQLINTVTEANNFSSLSKVEQIRSIYAIWNYNLLTDDLFELYKGIQMQADSTLLNYFCQIQLSRSSQREWQVLRCMAELEIVPIPYYLSYKRFTNYIKVSVPEWDLTPVEEKLKNTEYYVDCLRGKDQFYNIGVYRNLQKHFEFTQQLSPFEHTLPIQNLQLTQFGNATYQVTVDVVSEAAFVPGTNQLKQSYRNKIRSLQNLGWKHVILREKQLKAFPASHQVSEILYAFTPYIEEQQNVIANRDYYRSEQIQAMKVQEYWDGMVAEEAQGYRNNPQEYAKRVAELAEKQKKLSEQIAKVE